MNTYIIPFNKVKQFGNELISINNILTTGYTILDNNIVNKIKMFFYEKFNFKPENQFFTHTCSHALEMIALVCNFTSEDEIIVPSYTFVTSVSSFALRGVKLVFIDSNKDNPNLDCELIENLITKKTKAIVCVHYAGIPCDIDKLQIICKKYNLILIEDAAQAINGFYKGKPLGSFGSFSTFSFHETKNIQCGEGGLLVVNNNKYLEKTKIVYEKGTNRHDFKNGKIDKYTWHELGSSFAMSGITLAYLYSQLENFDKIVSKRKYIWNKYYSLLNNENVNKLFKIQKKDNHNYHMFYIFDIESKNINKLISIFKNKGILTCKHYITLHDSTFILNNPHYLTDKTEYLSSIKYSKYYESGLLRFPLFYELKDEQIELICNIVNNFCLDMY